MKLGQHEWGDSCDLIKYLEDKQLEDPLNFKKVGYYDRDWDNVPPVLPRYIFHLSKYTESLVDNMRKQTKLETVANLRTDTETKVADFNSSIKREAEISALACSKIQSELTATTEHSNELRKQFEEFSQSTLYSNEHL